MWQLYPHLRKLWIGGGVLGCLGLFFLNECLLGWLFKGEGCTLNQAVWDSLPTYAFLTLALLLPLVGLTLWARADFYRHERLKEARKHQEEARQVDLEARQKFSLLKPATELTPEDVGFRMVEPGDSVTQD